jgi:hypothetical protein
MPDLKINKSKNHSFPKDESSWVKFINNLHDDALSERQSLEMQWARNIAYYLGFQHINYDEALRDIRIDDSRGDEYIINRIAPFVEQRKAKITKSRPIMGVTPDDIDPMTIKGAELSEKVLRYLWKINDKDYKLDTLALYLVLMGSAFIKTAWDAEGGEAMKEDQDDEGNIVFDEQTGKQKKNLVWTGDIDTQIRSPWEILVAPGTKHDLCYAPWVCERSHRNVLEIKEMFPDFDISKSHQQRTDLTIYEKFVNNLGFPFTTSSGMDRSQKSQNSKELDMVLVKEFWMKPNYIYEEGVLATVVGDQLLQFEEMPYDHKEYPFVKVDEHKNPAGFYGISTVSRLIPVQRHYNESRSQLAKNVQLMANVKWWSPKGAGLADDALSDLEGEVVETNPNMPEPHQMGIVPMPNYIMDNQQQDIVDIRDIGNEREASQLPFPGLTASVALEKASEMSEIGLQPTLRFIERGLIRSAQQELMLANQFYTDTRKIKVYGRGQPDISVIKFDNEDLKHQTDVTIQVETSLAYSKSGARQNLMDMWDRRIISDPEAFMKAYVTGDVDIIMRAKDPVEAIVIQDIEMIKQGKEPPVSQFDNHVLWIKMLSAFIQTPEFRKIQPDRQQLATQVLQQHLQFMQPQAPMGEQNPAAVNTPFGSQVPEGTTGGEVSPEAMMEQPAMPMA